jgi:hypothetical protein
MLGAINNQAKFKCLAIFHRYQSVINLEKSFAGANAAENQINHQNPAKTMLNASRKLLGRMDEK